MCPYFAFVSLGTSKLTELYPEDLQRGVLSTTDKGPEIGYQYAFMCTLRYGALLLLQYQTNCLNTYSNDAYAPDIDSTLFPPHITLKSTNNTPIEGTWHQWLSKNGTNLKEHILHGKTE